MTPTSSVYLYGTAAFYGFRNSFLQQTSKQYIQVNLTSKTALLPILNAAYKMKLDTIKKPAFILALKYLKNVNA